MEENEFATSVKNIIDSAIQESRAQLLFDKLTYQIKIEIDFKVLKWYWRLRLKKVLKKQKSFEEGVREYKKAWEGVEADTRSLNDSVKPISEDTVEEIIKMIKRILLNIVREEI